MRLSDFLEPELVLLDLRTKGVDDTLAAVVDRLRDVHDIDEPQAVVRALAERESAHSTSLGNGVALPHATVPGIDRPMVVVAVAPEGVPFGEDEEEPVRVFFVLLSPTAQAGTHIKLLARIVRLVRRPGFVGSLGEADSGEALVQAIARMDALHV